MPSLLLGKIGYFAIFGNHVLFNCCKGKVKWRHAKMHTSARALTGISRWFGSLLPFCIVLYRICGREDCTSRNYTLPKRMIVVRKRRTLYEKPQFSRGPFSVFLPPRNADTIIEKTAKSSIEKRGRGQNSGFILIRFRRIFLHFIKKKKYRI